MTETYPFLRFPTGARVFLSRAGEHLARFEREEVVESFFYAALELRFVAGDARLTEELRREQLFGAEAPQWLLPANYGHSTLEVESKHYPPAHHQDRLKGQPLSF